jgi:hypothetical protein
MVAEEGSGQLLLATAQGAKEVGMRILENRRWRQQLIGKVQEYEGLLAEAEAELTAARKRLGQDFGTWAEQAKQAIAEAREAGRKALADIEQSAARLRGMVAELAARKGTPSEAGLSETGRKVVRRATIEAKALRHGVKVGLRMARRVSKRTKASKV